MGSVKAICSAALLGLAVLCSAQAQSPDRKRTVVGDLRVHADFFAKNLQNKRRIWVWLPPDYATETKRRYPVLYMGDGQNLFNLETSFLPDQEWRADETADALIRGGLIPPIILVGVDNAGADRANEYLPTLDGDAGGKVGEFGKFLVEEVKPFIDKTYRTKRGREDTALAGSSFGGIMALCVGLQYPDVFGKLGVLSPSVWWDHQVVLKLVDAQRAATGQKIWVDIGTAEGFDAVTNAKLLVQSLRRKGWNLGKNLAYIEDAGAAHNENAWARRLDTLMMWFFRG